PVNPPPRMEGFVIGRDRRPQPRDLRDVLLARQPRYDSHLATSLFCIRCVIWFQDSTIPPAPEEFSIQRSCGGSFFCRPTNGPGCSRSKRPTSGFFFFFSPFVSH